MRWNSSQPCWAWGCDGDLLRRHVPDFLLDDTAGLLVVDVKLADMLAEPRVAEALDTVLGNIALRGSARE